MVQIGPVAVRWYGVCYLVGFILGYLLARHRLRRGAHPWPPQALSDLALLYLPLGVVLGGRLGSALLYYPDLLLSDPLRILRIWEGGMSFHGALLGVIAAGWLFARHYRLRFFEVCDLVALMAPIGLGIGRLGNFINGELWGLPSDLPWAMVFPHVDLLPRHPSQIYQALAEGVLLGGALWWYARRPRPLMAISGLFLAGYALCRIAVEFVRAPDAHIGYLAWGWLTMGQLLSLPMLALGMVLVMLAYRRNPAGPTAPRAPPITGPSG